MPCIRCGNKVVENQDTGLCGSCGLDDRRAEARANKPQKVHVIRKVSAKEAKRRKTYSQLGKEHLAKHPRCQIKLLGCTKVAVQVHHSGKRGLNLLKTELFQSACLHCHTQIETVLSAKERREKGFLK